MEKFLQSTKILLRNLAKVKLVHVVIGNEACDLDSSAAALSYSYYLHEKKKNTDALFIPVLNIGENEFRLRTDTTYFLTKLKISSDFLTFRDQLDLLRLKQEKKLSLTLVDCNVLTGCDAVLDNCVVSVFDHHMRERPETEGSQM